MSIFDIPLTFAFIQNVIFICYIGLYRIRMPEMSLGRMIMLSLFGVLIMTCSGMFAYFLRAIIGKIFILQYFSLPIFIGLVVGLLLLIRRLFLRWIQKRVLDFEAFLILAIMNIMVLGLGHLYSMRSYTLFHVFLFSLTFCLGFYMAVVLVNAIRMRIEIERGPRGSAGELNVCIIAALIALALLPVDQFIIFRFIGGAGTG